MNYLGLGVVGRAGARLVSSCKDLYNDMNGANLTGAIDVIAIVQGDGSIKATPFHVRFGKWGVFRTGALEKEVEIEVNGELVDNKMMLIENGSAFFVTNNPNYVSNQSIESGAITPIMRPSSPDDTALGTDEREKTNEMQSNDTVSSITSTATNIQTDISFNRRDDDGHDHVDYLSDSALETGPSQLNIPSDHSSALSDSEVEKISKTQGEITMALVTAEEGGSRQPSNRGSSLWGTLAGILRKKKRRRFSSIEDGIYLDELDGGNFNEEEIAKYFPKPHLSNQPSPPTYSPVSEMEISDDTTSGIESSPSLSPYHTNITTTTTTSDNDNIDNIISILSDVSLSSCGSNGGNLDSITDDMFIQSQISFADFCSNPVNILNNPDLVVRINNRYYSWQVAGPMIMSCLVFAQTLPQPIHDNLTRSDMLKKSSRQSFWNFWGQKQNDDRTTSTGNNGTASTTSNGTNATVTTASSTAAGMEDLLLRDDETASEGTLIEVAAPPSMVTSSSWLTSSGGYSSLSSDDEESGSVTEGRRQQRLLKRKKFIFTNELTSDQLLKWPLKMGKNDIVFSITTKYQGTAKATCSLYLWNSHDKLVISDFDGTVTKSDVAGQVLPLIGKDWTQDGIIELFSAIDNNGYRFVYLSSRAIGQSKYTKNYLRSTCRGDRHLPDGPLLVTPFSLYTAFRMEVIEKKPEEFKISCLKQVKGLFAERHNPFHAGFGNKHSDAKSYHQVNIPPSRIFTVNHKGEIRNKISCTFQSSYKDLMEFVDGQFPPLTVPSSSYGTADDDVTVMSHDHTPNELFSSFVYWQHSLNNFDHIDLPPL